MKKFTLALILLVVFFTNLPQAKAGDFNRRFASFNLATSYTNDALLNVYSSMFSSFCASGSCSGSVPTHSLNTGANLEISLPIGSKWAFRGAAGYQYTAWHSATTLAPTAAFKNSATVNLLFDRYFLASEKLHPYWSIGAAVRRTVEFQPALGLGMHYSLSDRTSLKFQIEAGSLLMWSFLEPQVGVAWHF